MRRSVGTLVGLVGPAFAAVLVWVFGAPREELVSVGGERGVLFPGSGGAGGGQLLMLVVLLGAAAVCAVLVLWARHPGLRGPRGTAAMVLLPALTSAVAAAAASPLARALVPPARDVPAGTVVALPPEAGPLFTGRMVYGTTGPSWDLLPGAAGWVVFGAMVAAFTVAALAHVSASPDLADATPRTGR